MTTRTCTVRSHERRLPPKHPPIFYERLHELEQDAAYNRMIWDMESELAEISRLDVLAMMEVG